MIANKNFSAARLARKQALAPWAADHRQALATGPGADRWLLEANIAAVDLAAAEARVAMDGGTLAGWTAASAPMRAIHLEARSPRLPTAPRIGATPITTA
jgi:hypothetical protein